MADSREKYTKTKFTYTYPSDLLKEDANYPYMDIEIVKFPASVELLITDNTNGTSRTRPAQGFTESMRALGNAETWQTLREKNGIVDQQTVSKTESKGSIQLPITNNVANAIGIDWSMEDMPYTSALLGAVKNIAASSEMNTRTGRASDASLEQVGQFIGDIWSNGNLMSSVGTAFLSDIMKKTVNRIANPKKQALFNGIAPRTFQFDWIFTPTTLKEAQTIENIIKFLTKYSLPSVSSDYLIFDFPHEFIIRFRNVQGFPILDSCVCVGIQTNYTPNTLQLLESGHAVQILFSMSFMETTIRTQERSGL